MVGVAVSDHDMRNRRPLFLGDKAPEIENIEVLARIDCDPGSTLLNQERVIQVVGDLYATDSRRNPQNRGNAQLAVADRTPHR